MPQRKKKAPHQRAAYDYFHRLSKNKNEPEDEFHIINERERAAILRVKKIAMLSAGLTGAFAVAIYYIPLYVFPDFFNQFNQTLDLFGFSIPVNMVTISFS